MSIQLLGIALDRATSTRYTAATVSINFRDMLDQFKQMNQLRQLQAALKKESVTVERDGVSVTMRGDLEITDLTLSSEIDVETQAQLVLSLIGDAKKQIQSKMASAFGSMPK